MKIKVFQTNYNGKIEFTPAELEKLLNDIYEEGQRNCNCGSHITWTNPYTTPYITNEPNLTPYTVTTTLNSSDAKEISKHIDEVIKNATARTARIDNDAFSKLAKELNF